MRNDPLAGVGGLWGGGIGPAPLPRVGRQALIVALLVLALLAFEIFNFDTTRYALRDLLGEVSFAGLQWAAILAVAFCAIDLAGLARLVSPDREGEPWSESWYLLGAWLLAATMNALMTWWAVNLTLLNHPLGNEVLTREQLLHLVPIFVAVLVWLTRILFIGAFSIAGDQLFAGPAADQLPHSLTRYPPARPSLASRPQAAAGRPTTADMMAPLPAQRVQRPPLASMVSAQGRHRRQPPGR
jgi:hypothetical protein